MRLPRIPDVPDWAPHSERDWSSLAAKSEALGGAVTQGDTFCLMQAEIRNALRRRGSGLRDIFRRRIGCRAMVELWLEDSEIREVSLNPTVLRAMKDEQAGSLSRLCLHGLLKVYFKEFDLLDQSDSSTEGVTREALEMLLREQLGLLTEKKNVSELSDPVEMVRKEREVLLRPDGPRVLAERVRREGGDLVAEFEQLGLAGLDDGRYADLCRTHFYLDQLRALPVGEDHPVFAELRKPGVNKAPYQEEKRIGHAALEIIIDRGGSDPGEIWQDFVLSIAGDPRVAATSRNYADWWKTLGSDRVGRVRGWLSRADLRLFLEALQEFGKRPGKSDMRRMFPARKRFMEGLFDSGRIRATRLFLGKSAQRTIRRHWGDELKTEFATFTTRPDTAVIYLDCGEFHLLEGSHMFYLYVYLERPDENLLDYTRKNYTYQQLVDDVIRSYEDSVRKKTPNETYEWQENNTWKRIQHTGLWQRKAFEFLAANNIVLDYEALLTREEYEELKYRGLPVPGSQRGHSAW